MKKAASGSWPNSKKARSPDSGDATLKESKNHLDWHAHCYRLTVSHRRFEFPSLNGLRGLGCEPMAISLNDGNSFRLSLFVDDDIKSHTPLKSRSPRRVGIVRIRTANAFNAEMAKPLEGRHVILKWRDERNQQLRKHQDPEGPRPWCRLH